ncbi:MAG: hypothetical protein WEA59_07830 [Ferruginibacter sp.]
MKFFLLVVTLFIMGNSQAQQYLIKHDIQTKKTGYYKVSNTDTLKVKNIELKKSGRILLQVNNYNPFYWGAKVTAYKNPVEEEVGYADAFNPISILAGGFSNIAGSLPMLDLPKSRGGLNRGDVDDATYNYVNTATKYAEAYDDVLTLSEKLEELRIARLQLTELKYDINKTELAIKAEAQKTVKKVLDTENPDLTTVLQMGKNFNSRYTNSLEQAASLASSLRGQEKLVNPNLVYEERTLKEIGDITSSSFQRLSRIKLLNEAKPDQLMEEVAAIAKLYKEINTAHFQFSYLVSNEDDISDLKLEVYPKLDSLNKDTVIQYFDLVKKRNVKIRNSVGVAFTFFNANNTSYYIGNDSVIRSSDKDLFTPLLSTFIHFYAGKVKGIKLGGAFGFGIPLQGEKKDVNFLLGLTAAIGKNEPVLLTFGAAGAKVNKLSNGNKLGDITTETNPQNLVSAGYGIGGFMSITFNLSNLGVGSKK